MSTEIAPLALKLSKILAEVGKVHKDGYNDFHKYSYVTESALVEEIRPRLAAAGIFLFTSVINQETKGDITSVTIEMTFVDGESGGCFSVQGQGQGQDKGDKGVFKATTGAVKYAIMKNFLLSTGDDPEIDNGHQPATEQRATRANDRPPAARNSAPATASGPWQSAPIEFGKFKGKTLGDVAREDISYMQWLQEKWAPKPKNDGSIWPSDMALQAAIAASKAPAGDARTDAFVGEMEEVFEGNGEDFPF